MKKVCIVYETGAGRLPGHYTQFAFTGLPEVQIAALADSNPEGEDSAVAGTDAQVEGFAPGSTVEFDEPTLF